MTKDQKISIRNLELKKDGDSGDGKRAFFVGTINDGWCDLRIEVDTDDCDKVFALACMDRVVQVMKRVSGLTIGDLDDLLTAQTKH